MSLISSRARGSMCTRSVHINISSRAGQTNLQCSNVGSRPALNERSTNKDEEPHGRKTTEIAKRSNRETKSGQRKKREVEASKSLDISQTFVGCSLPNTSCGCEMNYVTFDTSLWIGSDRLEPIGAYRLGPIASDRLESVGPLSFAKSLNIKPDSL